MNLVRKHDRLLRRRVRLAKNERRLAYWAQLWSMIVFIVFVAKGVYPELPWQLVAWVAGGQTVLLWLLWLTNVRKHAVEVRRQLVEQEYDASQIETVETEE